MKKSAKYSATFTSAVGQLQIFWRTLRKTLTMPNDDGDELETVCSRTSCESRSSSARERREALIAGLLDARRGGVDRGERFLRRSADLDVGHRVNRARRSSRSMSADVLLVRRDPRPRQAPRGSARPRCRAARSPRARASPTSARAVAPSADVSVSTATSGRVADVRQLRLRTPCRAGRRRCGRTRR